MNMTVKTCHIYVRRQLYGLAKHVVLHVGAIYASRNKFLYNIKRYKESNEPRGRRLVDATQNNGVSVQRPLETVTSLVKYERSRKQRDMNVANLQTSSR